jgi:hypothetical protein
MSNMLLLLLPSSVMASEDEGQRTELTRKERERRATIPLLRRLVSERHHQQHQRCDSHAWIQRLQQEVDEFDVSNVQRLQVEAEALDLRVSGEVERPTIVALLASMSICNLSLRIGMKRLQWPAVFHSNMCSSPEHVRLL